MEGLGYPSRRYPLFLPQIVACSGFELGVIVPSPHSHWLSYLLRQILTALMAKPFQPEVQILHGRRKNPDKSVVPVV